MSYSNQMASCQCGNVQLKLRGKPIITTVCHCSGCKEAGRILQSLPHAPRILDADEGTSFVLYRKDRVDCVKGCEFLRQHRLSDTTPTRRVIATCCNSFMFLDFTKGHWITIVCDRIEDYNAALAGLEQKRQSAFFFVRLMIAWVRMGFRTPKTNYVKGELGSDVPQQIGPF